MSLAQYVEEFSQHLIGQLNEDQERWGDTWKQRPRQGQEERIFARLDAYRDQFHNADIPVPWLKIAALALIAWVRENKENHEA